MPFVNIVLNFRAKILYFCPLSKLKHEFEFSRQNLIFFAICQNWNISIFEIEFFSFFSTWELISPQCVTGTSAFTFLLLSFLICFWSKHIPSIVAKGQENMEEAKLWKTNFCQSYNHKRKISVKMKFCILFIISSFLVTLIAAQPPQLPESLRIGKWLKIDLRCPDLPRYPDNKAESIARFSFAPIFFHFFYN